MRNHRLLNRMQGSIGGGDAFDSADRFAVQLRHEKDAGVQGFCPVGIGDHNGAGPAVAFVTTFFGAAKPAIFAQPVEQGPRRLRLYLHGFPVEKKRDVHDINLSPYRSQ